MPAAPVQIAQDETSLAGPPHCIIDRSLGGRRWRIVTCAIAALIGTKWPRRCVAEVDRLWL